MQSTFKLVHFLFVLTVLGIAAVIVFPRLRKTDQPPGHAAADPPAATAATGFSR
ncbi:MAG: hypothetical protein OES79_05890 [Planctomycetota bacterium]|nr:hypothetical protein [Planctomycetota bacterium]